MGDELDVATELYCEALDAALRARSTYLDINARPHIVATLARHVVREVLPHVRLGQPAVVLRLNANVSALKTLEELYAAV